MVEQKHHPSYDYYRSMAVFVGLPDPGPIEDIEDPVKIEKLKADIEARENIVKHYREEIDSLQERLIFLKNMLNTYFGKPKKADGLKIIES